MSNTDLTYDGLSRSRAEYLVSLYEIADGVPPERRHPDEYKDRRFGIGTRTVAQARAEGWVPPWEEDA